MNGLPVSSFQDMLWWLFAIVFVTAIIGSAHTYAGLMIKKWWYGGDRGNRREKDEVGSANVAWAHELIKVQKDFILSNRELAREINQSNRAIADEIKLFSETMQALSHQMEKRSERAYREHEEILEEVLRIDVPRKAHP